METSDPGGFLHLPSELQKVDLLEGLIANHSFKAIFSRDDIGTCRIELVLFFRFRSRIAIELLPISFTSERRISPRLAPV